MKKLLLLALTIFLSGCEELGLTERDPYRALEKSKISPAEAVDLALASLATNGYYAIGLTFEEDNAITNYIVEVQLPGAVTNITINGGTGTMVRKGTGQNNYTPKGKITMQDAIRMAEAKTGGRTFDAHLVKGRPLLYHIKTSKEGVVEEVKLDAKKGNIIP